MAEPGVARPRRRAAPGGSPRGHHPREPRGWRASATTLRRAIESAFEAVAERWLALVGLVTLVTLVVLAHWGDRLAQGSEPVERCVQAALRAGPSQDEPPCAEHLRRLVAAAPPGDARTCTPGGGNSGRLCAFDEPGLPRLFVWADNLFVALYTLFFAGCIVAAYERLRPPGRPVPKAQHMAFVVSIASCLVGGGIDLAENFWLLARIGQPLDAAGAGLASVAMLSLWKFRLAGIDLALGLGWSAWAAWRQRIPYPLLFPWPRRCWDRFSRGWFDPTSVRYDVANAAWAHPLLPRDLMGLAGVPGAAELRCARDGARLRIVVRSAKLAEPYTVDVELDGESRGVRMVSLGCPNLAPALRDQGLSERIVLASCRAAWRLGAVALESLVPVSEDPSVRTQNRRWVRMALRLGWDAELSDPVRKALPPGLAHLHRLQALMAYPDGRRWWSTVNVPVTLRFICDPKRAQADLRLLDPEQLANDHQCLARLHHYAADQGIRLGL